MKMVDCFVGLALDHISTERWCWLVLSQRLLMDLSAFGNECQEQVLDCDENVGIAVNALAQRFV